MYFSTFISCATLFHLSIAGYVLEDDYMRDFYAGFEFFTAADPTSGFVKYVDQSTARDMGMINGTAGVVNWGVDTTNQAPDGRSSIRMTSKKTYDSGLVVVDVAHMPTGCGTWPAFWMFGPDWPNSGEVDILEGVNEQDANAMTLHTGPGCSISASEGAFAGTVQTSNCDVNAEGQDKNAGCSIKSADTQSYGAGLNAIGGGVYATQLTDEAISIWFFPRGSVPEDALGASPDPSTWGTPAAKFAGACDIATTFKQQQIVFDTTFCGDWAGNVWSSGSCASKAATCNDFVQNNPSAFTDAFWTINELKVYQDSPDAPASSAPATPPDSTAIPVPTVVPIPSETTVPSETPIPTVVPIPSESPVPSEVPIPSETTLGGLPLPTINVTLPTIAPETSDIVIETSTLAPLVSLPTGSETIPTNIPSGLPSRTRGGFGWPSKGLQSRVAIPTDGDSSGQLPGFNWPQGDGQTNDTTTAVPAESTGAPIGTGVPIPLRSSGAPLFNSTAIAVPTLLTVPAPSAPLGTGSPIVLPGTSETGVAIVPIASGVAEIPAPSGVEEEHASATTTPYTTGAAAVEPVSRVVETVYETVVVTVPYVAETPAPGSRRARHMREHRRRMTQHNGRR